jgi:hypothetical protein
MTLKQKLASEEYDKDLLVLDVRRRRISIVSRWYRQLDQLAKSRAPH